MKILLKTPGVDLGDIIKTVAGKYLIKEMVQRADLHVPAPPGGVGEGCLVPLHQTLGNLPQEDDAVTLPPLLLGVEME